MEMRKKGQGELPGKRKKIIRWIIALMIASEFLLGLIISWILITAISTNEHSNSLERTCEDGLSIMFLTCDTHGMAEAWKAGERNTAVDDFEREMQEYLQLLEDDRTRPLDGVFVLIPDGEDGYLYGGGYWYREEQKKEFMAPAADLPHSAVNILRARNSDIYIKLDLKTGRESAIFVDLVCTSFPLNDGSEVGYYCVIPSVRQMYRNVSLKNLDGIFIALRLVSMVLFTAMFLFIGMRLRRRIVVPLENLERSVHDYVSETRQDPNPENWQFRKVDKYCQDEIGSLTDSVAGMAEDMKRTTMLLLSEVKEKEKRDMELDMAARIQRSALPSGFPAFPDRHDFELFATMRPAKEVGGDFYDYFLVDGDHLCVVMGDVSDKGMPAALFMMMVREILRNLAFNGLSPAEVLDKANAQIAESNREELFVTVWIGLLCLSTGRLDCANAGHKSPLLLRQNGEASWLPEAHDLVLGSGISLGYTAHEHQMESGDVLFTYTDGVTEAMNRDAALFDSERLLTSLRDVPESDPQQIIEAVQEKVDAFAEGVTQSDDITMLALKYIGPSA